MEKRHSRLGIASFSASISVGVSMFLLVIVAGVMETRTPGGVDVNSPQAIAIGLFALGLFLIDIIAFFLGIIGLFQRDRKKIFAMLGSLFSALTIAGMIGAIILGNSVG